jgi:hypothetical protein
MKIALCFSGNIRDLNETKNFWTELIEKYKIDVYASFWDTENEKLGDTINNFLTIYTPKKYEIENYKVFKETTQDIASMHIQAPLNLLNELRDASKAFGQLPMYYKVWRCNLLTKEFVEKGFNKIDAIGVTEKIFKSGVELNDPNEGVTAFSIIERIEVVDQTYEQTIGKINRLGILNEFENDLNEFVSNLYQYIIQEIIINSRLSLSVAEKGPSEVSLNSLFFSPNTTHSQSKYCSSPKQTTSCLLRIMGFIIFSPFT